MRHFQPFSKGKKATLTQIRFWLILAGKLFCCLRVKEMFPPTMCDDRLDGIVVLSQGKGEISNFCFSSSLSPMLKISVIGFQMFDFFCREKMHNFKATITDTKAAHTAIHRRHHRYTSISIWSKQVKWQHRWNCHSVSMSVIWVSKLLRC